jgi:hypothetical protein
MGLGPFPSIAQMANSVRSGFQTMMGALDGYPYNALIVQGGSVLLSFPSGSVLPAGMIVTATLADASGNPVPCPEAVALPVPASGPVAISLGATMNVSYEYTLTVTGQIAGPPNDPVPSSWTVLTDTDTGNDLYAGLTLTGVVEKVAPSGSASVTFLSGGMPLTAASVFLRLVNASSGATFASGSPRTDGNGVATLAESWPFLVPDSFYLQWSFVTGGEGSGSVSLSGSQLASGFSTTVDVAAPGGAAAGTAGTVFFTVKNSKGETQPGAEVLLVLIWGGGTGDVWEVTETTGPGGTVGVTVPASTISASDTFAMQASASLTVSGARTQASATLTRATLSAADLTAGSLKFELDMIPFGGT